MRRGSLAHAVLERTLVLLRERTGSARIAPERLDAALSALGDALHERAGRAESARERTLLRGLEADLERYVRTEAECGAGYEPAVLEWSFGGPDDEHGPLALGDGETLVTGRVDRVDAGPGGTAVVRDYKGRTAFGAGKWVDEQQLQVALYLLAVRDLLGLEPVAGLYQPLVGRKLAARGLVRDDVPGRYTRTDLVDADGFAAGARGGARAGRAGGGRAARRPHQAVSGAVLEPRLPVPRHLPRGRARSGGARMRSTPEQRAAIADRGRSSLLAAGAGSGKTAVMVERFAEAVLHDGVAVGSILTLTFTEKAAAELRERIRRRFVELGEDEHARAVDAAWIGTIHGFCARLLQSQPLAAGPRPALRRARRGGRPPARVLRVRDRAGGLDRGRGRDRPSISRRPTAGTWRR